MTTKLIMNASLDDYVKLDKVGEGEGSFFNLLRTYGVVYKAQHRETNQLVAIKKIHLEFEDEVSN
ncbi:hypothetical protein DICVIV_06530 [Dictyocaulus viviparus]|uniref:Protein kinase domain-containing protein n=1 Tax=Dictyocaulus viviparus TaxID=29172 RepID=A0A0D8XU77_DICVI|nr:hypothetical protein DICVIV_06530 [Dictyocaulus viviparus]